MNNITFKILTSFILLFYFQSISSSNLPELPLVLDYYPQCQYKVIKLTTIKKNIPKKSITNGSVNGEEYLSLIGKLQERALKNNAQAIIIISSHFGLKKFRSKKKVPLLSYEAELIADCNDLSPNKERLAPVDSTGRTTLGSWSIKRETPALKFEFPKRPTLNRPEITNHNVSLSHGVYGVQLGFSKQQVEELLGTPNIELAILKNEDVIGYGRRLWLYFQKDKLVKIDTLNPPVSEEILNRIPLRDFFDSYPWKINNTVNFKMNLEQVRMSLKLYQPLINKKQLSLDSADKQLFLDFMLRKDPWTHIKTHKLGGFLLQMKNYKQNPYLKPLQMEQQFKIIQQIYRGLQQDEDIDVVQLKQQLGLPIGRIILKANRDIIIYNNRLLVESTNLRVVTISLLNESILKENRKPMSSVLWNISGLEKGLSLEATKNILSGDFYENYEKLEIDSDLYQMIISFESIENKLKLFEIEIKLY